jgi:hypothetical protein
MKKQLATLSLALAMTGCAQMHFQALPDDQFRLTKNSDACVIGSPDAVKGDLWMEAVKLCTLRRESPVEVESSGEYGIPYIRCASASLTFRCAPVEK